ncbi:response regulator [Telluribacter humicola]|uniref:response regulator n=1 Tax=Telluribacter humicola TaxID=1720261 RepID=UPI001A96A61F
MIRNILVIDDHEDSLYILKQLLIKNGIAQSVTTCRNSRDGLDYLEKSVNEHKGIAPDLILLDLDKPVMNGWRFLDEYTNRFQNRLPQTGICITTSVANRLILERSASYDVPILYFDKMFLFRDISNLIDTAAPRPRYQGTLWSTPHKEASVHPVNKFAVDTHYPGAVPARHKGLQ